MWSKPGRAGRMATGRGFECTCLIGNPSARMRPTISDHVPACGFPKAPPSSPSKSAGGDYGRAAERAMSAKRADYFACGTQVVWDVDLLSADVIKSYKASDPDHPVIFRRGDIADAEPAVPGWRMAVDDLFE